MKKDLLVFHAAQAGCIITVDPPTGFLATGVRTSVQPEDAHDEESCGNFQQGFVDFFTLLKSSGGMYHRETWGNRSPSTG